MTLEPSTRSLRIYIVEDEPLIAETAKMSLEDQGIKVLGISEDYNEALCNIQSMQANLVLLDINIQGKKDGETKPLGFIVKPFTESGLLSNVELAWHQISLGKEEYIIIRHEGERIKLNQASILYLKAFDNYCFIVTSEKEYLIPHTLKSTVEKLNARVFKKSHRSYVINITKVKGIKRDAVIVEDKEIPLSETYKKDIETLY